uniref:Orf148 n=1 Tax=Gracilaria firma TaxID=2510791 RepID=A0A1W6C6V4_9FLOR|nr:hypothetical protein [Gracilaria changii]ARJ60488.1 hypothetical protein [Gracilaria changii]ART65132.1 orf148 [Gracilaria changii]
MNQSRFSNQYDFVGVFDFIDNNFTKTENSLIFNTPRFLQVYNKFEKLSKIILTKNLFLECIIGQKFSISKKCNAKKMNFLFFISTIRSWKIFWFLDILLLSMFSVQQSHGSLRKVRITHLDFFWPNMVLDKLFMQDLMHNRFIIYNW